MMSSTPPRSARVRFEGGSRESSPATTGVTFHRKQGIEGIINRRW